MIRFILKNRYHDVHSGASNESFFTIDADVPQLQERLSSGGYGESGYDITALIGVETLAPSQTDRISSIIKDHFNLSEGGAE